MAHRGRIPGLCSLSSLARIPAWRRDISPPLAPKDAAAPATQAPPRSGTPEPPGAASPEYGRAVSLAGPGSGFPPGGGTSSTGPAARPEFPSGLPLGRFRASPPPHRARSFPLRGRTLALKDWRTDLKVGPHPRHAPKAHASGPRSFRSPARSRAPRSVAPPRSGSPGASLPRQ